MRDSLTIEPRHTSYGCGVYELGKNQLRVFVTDAGNVIPVEGRAITHEDLMQAYIWGRKEQEAMMRGDLPEPAPDDYGDIPTVIPTDVNTDQSTQNEQSGEVK